MRVCHRLENLSLVRSTGKANWAERQMEQILSLRAGRGGRCYWSNWVNWEGAPTLSHQAAGRAQTWVTSPDISLCGASQETPLGTAGEMLQVVKENEVEFMHIVSHRTPPQHVGTQKWQRTSLASPLQHHFTALRDVGGADPQAFGIIES